MQVGRHLTQQHLENTQGQQLKQELGGGVPETGANVRAGRGADWPQAIGKAQGTDG